METKVNQELNLLKMDIENDSLVYRNVINSSFILLPDPGYLLRYGVVSSVILSIAYAVVFVIGITGNIAVVIVVWRAPFMRSITNRFIANLAIADLLVNLLCLPFTLVANLFPAWILGVFFCKAVSYLQGVSVSASVNTLMAISLERSIAIANPLSRTMSGRHYHLSIALIWSVALIINLPWLFVFNVEPLGISGSTAEVCIEQWPSKTSENLYFLVANLIICYLGPLIAIIMCYLIIWIKVSQRQLPGEQQWHERITANINKSKIKVAKMVFVVIITFALCWLPLYCIFFITKFYPNVLYDDDDAQSTTLLLIPISQWLGASNSCINPILYAFMNKRFRAGFRNILNGVCCAKDNGNNSDIQLRH